MRLYKKREGTLAGDGAGMVFSPVLYENEKATIPNRQETRE
jgi:hypothetical protein